MQAEDLMAAVFPDAAACLENIPGDRQIPDHPLVAQTVRDCLEEAMDFDGLTQVLTRIHAGQVDCVTRDTPEPSVFTHEILNARPYAFVDDAPLEERRTQAVQTRRAGERSAADLGRLDAEAIRRVRDEQQPDPRDADELHDVLLTVGFLGETELLTDVGRVPPDPSAADPALPHAEQLVDAGRATFVSLGSRRVLVAAERLPEILALHPHAPVNPAVVVPAGRAARVWSREDAATELLRGRFGMLGPTDAAALAQSLAVDAAVVEGALLALESEGIILRGNFTPGAPPLEWCERRLLARIHRYTLGRLRAEIAPVSSADFMRFLFAWQHVEPAAALSGPDGLRAVLAQLDGVELPARAWERQVLPARVTGYEPAMLDMLSLTGDVAWARLSTGPTQVVGATPIALFLREHADAWLALRDDASGSGVEAGPLRATRPADVGGPAESILARLDSHGASFAHELADACGLDDEQLRFALRELVAGGLISSDSFAGLRAIIGTAPARPPGRGRTADRSGRWFALHAGREAVQNRAAHVEALAWALLHRYGVVFRRLLAREASGVPWRDLARVYRRLEARGDIRGGRFVTGMSGEQFALPDAVERLREIRRTASDGRLLTISAADPLNFVGVLTDGERIRVATSNRIVYRNGIPLAAMEGDMLRQLTAVDPDIAAEVAAAAAGRRVPVVSGYVGRA
jgi:ATP-dependent Lhr-like helicase